MGKKKKTVVLLLVIAAAIISISLLNNLHFFKYRVVSIYPSVFISEKMNNMDYIVTDSGDIIKLSKVVTIAPTLWKGSFAGTLFYIDGTSTGVKISSYGNFFGIEGESNSLFSDGVLYQYQPEPSD